jgi:hypothetical protein
MGRKLEAGPERVPVTFVDRMPLSRSSVVALVL